MVHSTENKGVEGGSVKKCSHCGETKPVSQFYKNKNISDGYRSECKECFKRFPVKERTYNSKEDSIRRKAWREKNKDRIREYSREYAAKNKERIKKEIEECPVWCRGPQRSKRPTIGHL